MYLKRLELFGFKSFADRTELEFVPGVTAVVGPNGSGKSNVSDAIRWVLGEQSAKSLRGAKMEDIIFAGSDSRRALNYSEVTLVLDNSDGALPVDYAEVAITRRVYRSGDSEYLLNKQGCRLKDITELFMDTGLGKEAYSIIGQGRIDEILSSKSEDRRGIFEEAAGVIKYKNRKKEAERRLDETEANLIRIQDIIHEIEDTIDPLKEQAEKAKKYKELKAELTEKEISTIVYQIESLHQKWESASNRLTEMKQSQDELTVEVNQEDANLQQVKWKVSQVEQELEKAQQKLLSATEEAEKLEGQREVLKERQKNFSSNKKEILEKLEQLKQKRAQQQVELSDRQSSLQALKQEVDQADHQLKQKEQLFHDLVYNVDEKLETLKTDYIDALNGHASVKNDLRYVNQSLEQTEQKIHRLKQGHSQYLQERDTLKRQVREKEKELELFNHTLDELRNEYQKELESRKQKAVELEQHQEKYQNYINQREKIRARKQFLAEMKEDFSGFFQGVKEVLKARRHALQNIDGAVAELIQVSKEYEMAVETALGAALQHVVVKDEPAAREAIQYLKKKRLGRATFLPRQVLKSRSLPPQELNKLQQDEGFIGVAHQLVRYDPMYQHVIENLLGHVIVTQDLKTANRLAKQVRYRYRFVTLDGDVVNPGGSMTGGSTKKNQNQLLGRDREIEQLAVELKKADEAIQEKADQIDLLKKERQRADQTLEDLRSEAEQIKDQGQVQKERLNEVLFSQKQLDEKLQSFDQEMQAYQADLEEYKQRKITCEQQIGELQANAESIEKQIEMLEHEKKESEQVKVEKSEEITGLKIHLARKIQEFESLNEQVQRQEQAKQETDHEWEEAQELLLRLEGNLNQQGDEEDTLEIDIKAKKELKDQITEHIHVQRQQRKQLHHEWENLDVRLKELRKERKIIEDTAHQEEVKVNRLDVELEQYLTVLREEYELSFEFAKQQYPLKDAYEGVKNEVDQLKRDIQRLGTVNLGAMEEYDRVLERFQFLKKQEDDLIQAKDKLYEVIAEMDEEMTHRFKETFDLVREQFMDVFQQLFGGGRADLLLTDPEDLLRTGVDIVAQPPGKKLQHLALLSGGEKALTAIALLFAILRVKPVPFCVLDEVEAALDEANVSRFAQYLKEFAAKTQFIVITHRKGTMEGADVLYGITMQESGVSTLVSVKLEEKDKVISA